MIPFEVMRHLRIAADDSRNLVHTLFRHMESNQGRGMQAEMAGFKHRGYAPDNTGILQRFHPADYISFRNPQPFSDRFPWPGYEREVILQGIEYGQIGLVRQRRALMRSHLRAGTGTTGLHHSNLH